MPANETSTTGTLNLTPARFAPDAFEAGSPDKFWGEIVDIYAAPWCSPKSTTGKHLCYVFVRFKPDEDSGFDEFERRYQAGFLTRCVPSNDGKTPAGGDIDHYVNLSKGLESIPEDEFDDHKGEIILGAPIKGMDWDQFVESLATAGFDAFGDVSLKKSLIGLRAFLHQVDQKRGGAATDTGDQGGQQQRRYQILVADQIDASTIPGKGKNKSGAAKVATTGKGAGTNGGGKSNGSVKSTAGVTTTHTDDDSTTDTDDEPSEIETLTTDLVNEVLAAHKGKPVPMPILLKEVTDRVADKVQKREVFAQLKKADWMQSEERMWTYDKESNSVS
jgi:hypothetical protein